MCVHTSHRPYGYTPLTLCSWQRMHWNPSCNLWHLCYHCARCWFPCQTKAITCASFHHIQFLSSMNQHCAYQKWHSHLSQCYCQPNTSGFTSQILCNLRLCYLWCSSSQIKELLQPTPHWSIPPLNNWSIWLHKHVNVFLHDCAHVIWSLKGTKSPHLSTFVTFLYQKVSITL